MLSCGTIAPLQVEGSPLCYSEIIPASKFVMQSYPLAEVGDPGRISFATRSSEVFEQAAVQPVVLTEALKPEFVIMSIQNYQQLLDRLADLEDRLLGQLAAEALQHSQMIGSAAFTAGLEKLAEFEQNRS